MQCPSVIVKSQAIATGLQLRMLARILATLYPAAMNTMVQTAMWKLWLGKMRR
jgi:hypothetical protein